MSTTTNDADHVSPDECARLREYYAAGQTAATIATDRGWAKSTVLYHVQGRCAAHDAPATDANGCLVERPHLTQDPPDGTRHAVAKRSEAYCRDCKSRITVTPDGLELGHRTKHTGRHERCPNRPAEGVDPVVGSNTGRRPE